MRFQHRDYDPADHGGALMIPEAYRRDGEAWSPAQPLRGSWWVRLELWFRRHPRRRQNDGV